MKPIAYTRAQTLPALLQSRIAILDGAMSTQIQGYGLQEEDYRGDRFRHFERSLKGNNDLLVLTRPQVIEEIRRRLQRRNGLCSWFRRSRRRYIAAIH